VYRHLADAFIVHTRYFPANLRKSFNQSKGSPRLSSKTLGDARIAITVPT